MRAFLFLFSLLPALLLAEVRFTDDFEDGDLAGWDLLNPQAIRVIDSNNADHGKVLELQADDAVLALIRDSEQWGAVRLEGDVFFPDDGHNYLAFVYHFEQGERRTDFGSLYLKGNGSYIRASPWRDIRSQRRSMENRRSRLPPPHGASVPHVRARHCGRSRSSCRTPDRAPMVAVRVD